MPDVRLFSATEPLPTGAKPVAKYVGLEGLPVYTESWDVAKAADDTEWGHGGCTAAE